MFDFFKRKKIIKPVKDISTKTAEDFAAEYNYKIIYDEEYRKSVEKSRAFFKQTEKHRKKQTL